MCDASRRAVREHDSRKFEVSTAITFAGFSRQFISLAAPAAATRT